MTGSVSPRLRALVASAAAVVFAASLLIASPASAAGGGPPSVDASSATTASVPSPTTATAATGIAKSANLALFRPGNIIADDVFFNASTMSAAQIDSFLKSKVSVCRSSFACLRDYRQNTPSRSADAYCKGYSGAGNETSAAIIHKVAQSCGINPQVLIVMLEKEQSLVTSAYPTATRFNKAMGQGCPDTAGCDPNYAGFFYQVYGAARQMKIYAEGRWFTYYAPGKTWNIQYNPNRSCGSSPVYVENIATAALYYYTPYQPNRAALNAGYGTGDGCSAYGNRNFFQFFSDWFGDPRSNPNAVSGVIADVWNANGGASGWIGAATSRMRDWPNGPGWSQQFANADIFVKSGKPGRIVTGPVRAEYRFVAEVASGLGWPTTDRVVITGGAYQDYEGGRIYERADGRAFAIAAPFFGLHESAGNVYGTYGWPTSRAYAVPGGSVQTFDKGTAYQSGTNVIALDSTWTRWLNESGGTGGPYGFPVSAATNAGDSTLRVLFTKAAVYRKGDKIIPVMTPLLSAYADQGYEGGPLGRPSAASTPISGGTSQDFAGGRIYSSPAGTYAVTAFTAALASAGGVGKAGFPTGAMVVNGAASSQSFTGVTLTRGAGGQRSVVGAIKNHYDSVGGAASFLGAAKGAEAKLADGFVQEFDGGRVVCSPTALVALPKSMAALWDKLGGQSGRLGWPLGASTTANGITEQTFQGGLLITDKKGVTQAVFGTTLNTFRTAGGVAVLGAPIEAEQSSAAGYSQRFEKGVVFVPFSGSASAVALETFGEYVRGGSLAGFGFATGIAAPIGVGKAQPFQLGSIATSSAGTYAIRGTMWNVFRSSGGYTGPLSFPLKSEAKTGTGFVQSFMGGTAYVSPHGLAVTRGVLEREYLARGGVTGSLGWPLSNETSGNGVWQQRFQNGTIVLTANGTVTVR